MGALYALSGFSSNPTTTTLSSNPRAKNLLWVLSGAGFAAFFDPKTLSLSELLPEERLRLVTTYIGWTLGAAAVLLLLISVIIFAQAELGLGGRTALRGRGVHLAFEFLFYGYSRYEGQRKALEEDHQRVAIDPRVLGEIGAVAAAAMQESVADALPGAPASRHRRIGNLLGAIEELTRLCAPNPADLSLKVNYMARVGRDAVSDINRVKFLPANHGRYQEFLALRCYRSGERREVFLAIEPPDRAEALLPGAPTAVAKNTAHVINCDKIKFANGVPATTRASVKAYFQGEDYASVLSIPLASGQHVVGVVNIESSRIDVVGAGPQVVSHLEKALMPLCLALAEVVRRDEGI